MNIKTIQTGAANGAARSGVAPCGVTAKGVSEAHDRRPPFAAAPVSNKNLESYYSSKVT